ncbi:MAG: OmpA family protein [Nitrospinaceae bacterium]
MMSRNKAEFYKEQIRIQSLLLKKRDTQYAKQQERFNQVLQVSRKKIDDLKLKMNEKELIPLDQMDLTPLSVLLPGDKPNHESYSKYQEPAATDAPPLEEVSLVRKNQKDRDRNSKLSKELNQLKINLKFLIKQLRLERKNKRRNEKEKSRLEEEVERLRKNPGEILKLKQQISHIEEKSRSVREGYKKLQKEKRKLITACQKNHSRDWDADNIRLLELNREKIGELKQDLRTLEEEKKRITKELDREKERFHTKLNEKIQQLERDWGGKLKTLRVRKDRLGHFAEQIMEEAEPPIWMVTYSDMATLLLTFFILLYSIASMNVQKFKSAIFHDKKSSLGLLELVDSTEIQTSIQQLTGLKSTDILTEIKTAAENQASLETDTSASRIVVIIPGNTLFQSASADLEKSGWPLLNDVARIFRKYPEYKIHIQGHTDDMPIFTERFPTNWELSAARATAVLRYFIDKGIKAERLTATGYADTFPLVPNTTELGRSKNRRVEFVLEKE